MSGTVLVTGASGGLGLSLVAALSASGRQVVAVGRRDTADPRLGVPGVRYVRADISERSLAEIVMPNDVETVFHCAALSSPWGDPREFERANVDATRNVLHAAATRGARTFVHVSTPSIYADMRDRIGITEGDAPADPPLNHYARTKLKAEYLALSYDWMNVVAIRPRAIVGPDDTSVLPRLIDMARRGKIPTFNEGRALIELTDVRDVVSAMLHAEEHAEALHGRAVNISGGRPERVAVIAARLATALRLRIRFRDVPLKPAILAARTVEALWPARAGIREPMLTRYAISTLAYSQTFDLSMAREALRWHPEHDGLETLLAEAKREVPRNIGLMEHYVNDSW